MLLTKDLVPCNLIILANQASGEKSASTKKLAKLHTTHSLQEIKHLLPLYITFSFV